MPEGITDRPAEIWEPLLAIADTAGGHWPNTARGACQHFVHHAGPQITSNGVRLLADLRHVFTLTGADRMSTADILAALIELEESSWADLNGKPLDARRLGRELGKYRVRPKDIKIDGRAIKGYRADGDDGLADAWSRYLPVSATAATTATDQVNEGSEVADTDQVADTAATPDPAATHLSSQVAVVAAVADTSYPPHAAPPGPEGRHP